MKSNGVNYGRTVKETARRRNVIKRLENQLKVGTKTEKSTREQIPLEEKDIKRIQKEIATLQSRV